ncbi:MAG: succinyl-diaminopimelate desuccinylase [Acidobacteria bacterium]|nr:succinyl-diaminopimelate desuccinylase [Acidobacteriota bacterium]
MNPIDPAALARALIRCRSITPEDGGAIATVQAALEPLGFTCQRLPFSSVGKPEVQNLYARLGTSGRNFCFAGHTDVVPAGDVTAWSVDPFGGEVRDRVLYGRGAADMKSAIACFAAAVGRFLAGRGGRFAESISVLVTGDEEGSAVNGTRKVLAWLSDRGERLDVCLVGEPTNPSRLGEAIKIGRRGSLSGVLTVTGVAGHAAYPHLADNPLPRLVRMLSALTSERLDEGTEHFQPSDLQLTTIDVGNPAPNVIPARARAAFNVRFNDRHTAASLEQRLRRTLDAVGGEYLLDIEVMGEAFLTPPGPFTDLLSAAIRRVTGLTPELSTTGGTSDARFIKDHCPVAEFGLIARTIHKPDECVALADMTALTDIYEAVLAEYFTTAR